MHSAKVREGFLSGWLGSYVGCGFSESYSYGEQPVVQIRNLGHCWLGALPVYSSDVLSRCPVCGYCI